jgi:hypothetical protein
MNRRNFLKFMAVTPAAGAASVALAKLPGVVPQIHLLEPQKIITDLDAPIVFKHIIRYKYSRDENLNFHSSINSNDIHTQPGRLEQRLDIETYLQDARGVPIGPMAEAVSTLKKLGSKQGNVMFDVPELRGRLFILSSYKILADVSEQYITVQMSCYQIGKEGYLV